MPETNEDYEWEITFKKMVGYIAVGAVSYIIMELGLSNVDPEVTTAGVTLITATILGGYNYLKHKYNW